MSSAFFSFLLPLLLFVARRFLSIATGLTIPTRLSTAIFARIPMAPAITTWLLFLFPIFFILKVPMSRSCDKISKERHEFLIDRHLLVSRYPIRDLKKQKIKWVSIDSCKSLIRSSGTHHLCDHAQANSSQVNTKQNVEQSRIYHAAYRNPALEYHHWCYVPENGWSIIVW